MATPEAIDVIKKSFKDADAGSTGRMSRQLCATLFKDISTLPEEDISRFFNSIPVDADGMLSYSAFVDWVFLDGQQKEPQVAPEVTLKAEEAKPDEPQDAPEVTFKAEVAEAEGSDNDDGFSESEAEAQDELTPEEVEELERRKRASGSRRKSVQAASVNEDDIKNYKCPSYPKSDDAKQKIRDSLTSNTKMATLGVGRFNEAQMDEMVMAFQAKKVVLDQDVIRQGEEGECLYIIDEGNFDIFVARPGEDGTLGVPGKVANFGEGALFGELALLYSAPRAATVTCVTEDALLWSLDREPFSMLLKRCGVQMVEQYCGWLTGVRILKQLNLLEKGQVADVAESILLDEGEEVFHQGDEADAFYILEDGVCGAFVETANGEESVATYEKQGEYFGELGLLNNEPRKATVKAMGDAVVLKIEKQAFDDLLGPIVEQLRARAKKYPPLPA